MTKTESTSIGQFTCSLEMLAKLLGFPEHVKIKHVGMVPYGIVGQGSVRVVVEDSENIPAMEHGAEVMNVSPSFKLGKQYREFTGWTIYDDSFDEADAEQ